MKKIIIICGVLLIVAGAVLFGIGSFMEGGFLMSSDGEYEEKTYDSADNIEKLIISDDCASVEVKKSADSAVHLKYFENERRFYEISESGGVLTVTNKNTLHWYDYIFMWSLGEKPITVEIPEISADITTSNGRVEIDAASFSSLSVKTSNAACKLTNVRCTGDTDINSSNGAINISSLAAEDVSLRTSNALLKINDCECSGNLTAKTSNGELDAETISANNVTATSSNGKITLSNIISDGDISADTSNAKIHFDSVTFIGEIRLTTSNGDVDGTLDGSFGDYSYDVKTSNGSSSLPEGGTADKKVIIHTSNASVDVDFSDEK